MSRPVDLEALYAEAEAAMRARSFARARRTLETIVDRDGNGPLGEAALIDLARLALAGGDREEARRALARLPSPVSDPALAETAAHLRSRIAPPARVASDRDGGDPCVPGAAATSDTRWRSARHSPIGRSSPQTVRQRLPTLPERMIPQRA